ncbi:MAG: BrnT family toxin [Pseudomonadota bacterium]|nr:BrnT family toxin [Pseudomonadota bacterium]
MVDWALIEGFQWEAGNERKSDLKHAVSAAGAEQVFFNEPLLVAGDAVHSTSEVRWHALGHNDAGRLLHVTFTLRMNDTLIRVISARDMHRKERIFYDQDN